MARASRTSNFGMLRKMKTFVRLREMLATHKDLATKIAALEKKSREHDATIDQIFEAIHQLMEPEPVPPSRQIGFVYKQPKGK